MNDYQGQRIQRDYYRSVARKMLRQDLGTHYDLISGLFFITSRDIAPFLKEQEPDPMAGLAFLALAFKRRLDAIDRGEGRKEAWRLLPIDEALGYSLNRQEEASLDWYIHTLLGLCAKGKVVPAPAYPYDLEGIRQQIQAEGEESDA